MALGPYDPFGAPAIGDSDLVDPSSLPGAKGVLAVVYRALRPLGLFPPVIRKMEWWEIGVLLGADIGPPPPRIIMPNEPVPSDGPRPTGPRLMEVD